MDIGQSKNELYQRIMHEQLYMIYYIAINLSYTIKYTRCRMVNENTGS